MLLQTVTICWLIIYVDTYNLDTLHPLVYELPVKTGRLSYFGYSVVIRPRAAEQDDWSIQIGAPRSNVSELDVKEPGVVYRCATFGPCQKFVVDRTGNEPGGKGTKKYIDRKDRAWTGVAMDIKDTSAGEKSVICGHRWANQYLKNADNVKVTYLMTGVCYLQDLRYSNATKKLLPLVDQDNIYFPRPYVQEWSRYDWGLGHAGMSVEIAESGLIMGAPGVFHWTGSVIRYDEASENVNVGSFRHAAALRRDAYAYIGYQVATGVFFGNGHVWHVAGAPRSSSYHGRVFLFQFQGSTGRVNIVSNLTGSTFGEYFGAALAVSDVNNDGFDDLIIGAPLYSIKEPEEGRIYVYLGTSRNGLLTQSQVMNGAVAYGRFGTCISSIGDLDQDGFLDIAVGAPYESDRRGAVYIFRGSSKGLITEYSQMIFAGELDASLRGFGIAISRGVDVDSNFYPDLLIGSYLSDQAVVLRSRPVVSIRLVIHNTHFPLLDRRLLRLNVTACSRYTGNNAPSFVNVTRVLQVDPRHGRAVLVSSGSSKDERIVRLSVKEEYCEIVVISLNNKNKRRSFTNPLEVILRIDLPVCGEDKKKVTFISSEKVAHKSHEFLKWCPVGSGRKTALEIPFAGECGADGVCTSDIRVLCNVLEAFNNSYVIGSSHFVTLSIELKNFGEPAYNVKLNLTSDLDLTADELEQWNFFESEKRSLWTDVETTFHEGFQKTFALRISLDSLLSRNLKQNEVHFKVAASTTSQEANVINNNCDLSLRLLSDVSVDLRSSSSITTFSISEKEKDDKINFTQVYEVQRKGETPILNAELCIFVPAFYNIEYQITAIEAETSDWVTQFATRYGIAMGSELDDVDMEFVRSVPTTTDHIPLPNRTLFVNCSTQKVQCTSLEFSFPDGIPAGVSSVVKIFITLDLSIFNELMKEDKNIVYFSTNAVLKVPKLCEAKTLVLSSNTSVAIFKETSEAFVESYVVALSVLAGGLLLSLIISALVKKNFFHRGKREELKALRTAEMQTRSGFDLDANGCDSDIEIFEEI